MVRANKLILMAATAGMIFGSGAAMAQTGGANGGGNGGSTPPGVPTTEAQGTPNAIPPSYGVSRSTSTAAAPSSTRYPGQGERMKTFNGQPTTGSSTTPGQPNTATQ
jgi:hypothetical protein